MLVVMLVVVIVTSAIAAVVEVVQALLQRVDIAFVVKVLLAVVLRHSLVSAVLHGWVNMRSEVVRGEAA